MVVLPISKPLPCISLEEFRLLYLLVWCSHGSVKQENFKLQHFRLIYCTIRWHEQSMNHISLLKPGLFIRNYILTNSIKKQFSTYTMQKYVHEFKCHTHSLVPRPPPFLPSVCVHNKYVGAEDQWKTGKEYWNEFQSFNLIGWVRVY